ncbi:HAD-IA family hydrolase [Gammaproteobacteria bacterium AB-CW1]|uniref:HAD-IA family hydrolase n=1 Tax=Natronospira elongata TaxID=3110268 RepID=A0AAP6JIH2_9GAMM|nr:HAD-IA family hydrolase [Gammaproteobacteria bacterium AB-CW1]
MTRIQAISFDLDDTLWPVAPVITAAEQAVHDFFASQAPTVAERFDVAGLRDLRVSLARELPHLAHDLSLMRRLSLERACQISGVSTDLAEPAFQVFFQARNRVEWYPDVAATLGRLAQRFPLVALTNGNADLQLTGLAEWFRFSLSAIEVGAAKPDPAMFHAAADRLALAPEQILHVGDDPGCDLAGAHSAGFQAVLIDRQGRHKGLATKAPVITSLEDLPVI